MIDIYQCGIDGVMPYIYLKLIDGCLIVEKTISIDNDFGFAVVARKNYKCDLQFTEIGNLLKYDNNKANCYIKLSKNYPRSNPKEISLIYQLHPLRQIEEGQELIAKPYNFQNNQQIKIASSPLRDQPDYKSETTQDKMKKIVSELYEQQDSVLQKFYDNAKNVFLIACKKEQF